MTSFASSRGEILFVREKAVKQIKRLLRRISNDNQGTDKP